MPYYLVPQAGNSMARFHRGMRCIRPWSRECHLGRKLCMQEWPDKIQSSIQTQKKTSGTITNSDLKMAGQLLQFLVMEKVCPPLTKNMSHYSATTHPPSAGSPALHPKILRWPNYLSVLWHYDSMQTHTCPLAPLHILGLYSSMTDMPSRSFGSNTAWHCKTNNDLLPLYLRKFPLPPQPPGLSSAPAQKSVCK
jgi:hypothetical protein